MGNNGTRIRTGLAVAILVVLAGTTVANRFDLSRQDVEPPVIHVLAAEPVLEDQPLRLAVRAFDRSGVGKVVAWVHGETDPEFRPLDMRPLGGDVFFVDVPSWTGRGQRISYYVEAFDQRGNGPGRSGNSETPYYVAIHAPSVATPSGGALYLAGGLGLAGFAATFGWTELRRRRNRRDRQFWHELVTPLGKLEGAELIAALESVCNRPVLHPDRGWVRVKRAEVTRWLGAPQGCSVGEQRKKVADEAFWLDMLEPVLRLAPDARDAALQALAAKPHVHPLEGPRMCDLPTLRQKLAHLQRLRPSSESKPSTMAGANPPARDPRTGKRVRRESSGSSLVEFLVAITLLALALGIGALYLQPAEAPLRTSGELLEGLFLQTRTKALATTTAYRVRPLDNDTFVVESAPSCGSSSWLPEHDMQLELPGQVTVQSPSPLDWAICFDTRGMASSNVVITLRHAEFGTRDLEVLMGGSVRWLG